MRPVLTVLALILPAAHLAGQPASAKKVSAIAVLPDGSELSTVMLPRYDENRKLVSVLKVRAMTLVGDGKIAGTRVGIELFNEDQTPRARIDLEQALFDQRQDLLVTQNPAKIRTATMFASGSALTYAFEKGKGFLSGPALTIIRAKDTPTTMNSTSTSPLLATAALGVAMVMQPLAAAPPPPLTAVEAARLQADTQSKASDAVAAGAGARASLQADLAAAAAASQSAASFLAEEDIPAVTPDAAPAKSQPLDVKPGPADTVINCDGGIYFDAEAGVLVYLKNVTVKDPRFDLSGASELKIFFGKKAAGTAAQPKGAGFGKIGDAERIVATGNAVLLHQKNAAGKEPIDASGKALTYDLKKNQIIVSDGFPWVTQGTTYMRAKKANLILRIFPETGNFITEGNWEMGGKLDQKP